MVFKRIAPLCCTIILIFSLTSCTNTEVSVEVKRPLKIAVVQDSTEAIILQKYALDEGAEILEYTNLQGASIDVQNEKADCILLSSDTATDEFLNKAKLMHYKDVDYKIGAFAITSKENKEFADKINLAIEKLSQNGVFEKIEKGEITAKSFIYDKVPTENGTITILCPPIYDNRLFFDENGNLYGKDLAFIYAICQEIGVTPEIKPNYHVDELFSSLENGEADIIMPFYESTAERSDEHILTEPFSYITFSLYEKADT